MYYDNNIIIVVHGFWKEGDPKVFIQWGNITYSKQSNIVEQKNNFIH